MSPANNSLLANLAVRHASVETVAEIDKLKSALHHLSADTGRGNGAFYDSSGSPASDHWLAVVWAIASLGWQSGKEIARQWSTTCSQRFTDNGFEEAWNSFDPDHPHPIGIGSLYKRVKELGWKDQAHRTPTLHDCKSYQLLTAKQLELFPPHEWALKHTLPLQGIAALYGPSQSGKSFLAFDLGIAIAEGRRWFGKRTKKLPVVYVALEGEAGIRNRVRAWEQMHQRKVPDTFYFLLKQSFHLDSLNDVSALASTVPRNTVIIIDTLNRAAPTADENSSQDMGKILEGTKRLQMLTEGLVLIVHHTGKDPSRGARGHSSFFAALDAAIEVKRDKSQRSWNVAKSKDSEDGVTYFFDLKSLYLEHDNDLEPVTSCVVQHTLGSKSFQKEPSGRQQKIVLKTIRCELSLTTERGRAGAPTVAPCIKEDAAIEKVAMKLTDKNPSRARYDTSNRIEQLILSGHLCVGLDQDERWLWLPE
jgi:hypothetical protein